MRGERKISKLIAEFTGCAVWRGDDFMFVLGDGVPGIQWTDGEDAVLNKIWVTRLSAGWFSSATASMTTGGCPSIRARSVPAMSSDTLINPPP